MQILLEACKNFLDQKRLMANAGKSASLRVVPVAKKKVMKVITKVQNNWGSEDIPSITFQVLAVYQGVEIRLDGTV